MENVYRRHIPVPLPIGRISLVFGTGSEGETSRGGKRMQKKKKKLRGSNRLTRWVLMFLPDQKLCEKDGSAQVYYGMLARTNGIFLLYCFESFHLNSGTRFISANH